MATLSEMYSDVLIDYRKWLTVFPEQSARWKRRFKDQPQPAIVEACVRSYLAAQVDSVEPAEDLVSGGPDFRCRKGCRTFYVESTCLTIDAVTNATKLSPTATGRAANYGTMTDLVKRECVNKAAQLSSRKDAPGLLAIGTLHFQAGGDAYRNTISKPSSLPLLSLLMVSILLLARPSAIHIRPSICGIPRSLSRRSAHNRHRI